MMEKLARGARTRHLQTLLAQAGYPPGRIDGAFGRMTEAALLAFQYQNGLAPHGVVDTTVWKALSPSGAPTPAPRVEDDRAAFDPALVGAMAPHARADAIARRLPLILASLWNAGLTERRMVLMALATIRAESDGFEPVSERVSRFNTSPGGRAFDRYDHRADLGNRGLGDGARFKGRGFVQLTGRRNYARFGRAIGLGETLLRQPERANEAPIAAALLAAFLGSRRTAIRRALARGDLARARRLVNGGVHGLERFKSAYRIGAALSGPAARARLSRRRRPERRQNRARNLE